MTKKTTSPLGNIVLFLPVILFETCIGVSGIAMLLQGDFFAFSAFAFGGVFAGALLIGFINLYRHSRTFLPIEQDQRVLYTETCGGWFDYANVPVPFVRVSIYDGFLVISYLEQFSLSAGEIDSVNVRWLPSPCVQIRHHKIGISNRIILWSLGSDYLKNRVETLLELEKHLDYPKAQEKKKVNTGKKEFWPWLND